MTRSYVRRLTVTGVDDSQDVQSLQAELGTDYVIDAVENMQPQGLRFVPRNESEGILVCPDGRTNQGVAVGVHDPDDMPLGTPEPGTGGLYYAGEFKIFLDDSGNLVLCGDTDDGRDAADWLSVDSKVQAELLALQTSLTALTAIVATHAHPPGLPMVPPAPVPPAPVGPTKSDKVKIPT